jgi:hypothetical protein
MHGYDFVICLNIPSESLYHLRDQKVIVVIGPNDKPADERLLDDEVKINVLFYNKGLNSRIHDFDVSHQHTVDNAPDWKGGRYVHPKIFWNYQLPATYTRKSEKDDRGKLMRHGYYLKNK